MSFAPIAIVGQSCVLPGALSPQELWEAVVAGKLLLSHADAGSWGGPSARFVQAPAPNAPPPADKTWHDIGGYVRGFQFDANGFQVPAELLTQLAPLFQWVLHTGRTAFNAARFTGDPARVGAILGNLSYPTQAFDDFCLHEWLPAELKQSRALPARPHPLNRFMSGYPAQLLAQALGVSGRAYCLDAACASSLYAIKLACDALQRGETDLMLAGGVNAINDLFLHVGFTSLLALSKSGQSRPFHRAADGLVPALGAAVVALQRLEDAEASGAEILGVIRGIGLSNDGSRGGFLSPSASAQVRALEQAYRGAGLSPQDISLIECHATGTVVGDGTEITSLSRVLGPNVRTPIPIGSLKSNLGHLTTAAGAAGLLKVLGAFKAGIRPPTINAEEPLEQLAQAPLRLLTEAEPWDSVGPRRAAVSAFGFGGNNAHLIVEEYQGPASAAVVAVGETTGNTESTGKTESGENLAVGETENTETAAPQNANGFPSVPRAPRGSFVAVGETTGNTRSAGKSEENLAVGETENTETTAPQNANGFPSVPRAPRGSFPEPIAIVGIGVCAADLVGREAFAKAWLTGASQLSERDGLTAGFTSVIELDALTAGFPPNDLAETHPQQLQLLTAAREALRGVALPASEAVSVFIGMGTDTEVGRYNLRLQLPALLAAANQASQESQAKDAAAPVLTAARTIGCMPNIPANRLNVQANFQGPSLTFSAEELSGIIAFENACAALRSGEADAVLAGASDFCAEAAHAAAAQACLPEDRQTPGDAAVVLVLKRLSDAEAAGDTIFAVCSETVDETSDLTLGFGPDAVNLTPQFGHAHAASGLLHVAAGALALHHRALPGAPGQLSTQMPLPWLPSSNRFRVRIELDALGGQRAALGLTHAPERTPAPLFVQAAPQLQLFAGADRRAVIERLRANQPQTDETTETGPARLAIVAAAPEEFARKREQALQLLSSTTASFPQLALLKGIYYADRPLGGEVAFTFPPSAGAYSGMGRELLLAFPELVDGLRKRVRRAASLREAAQWAYDAHLEDGAIGIFDKLKGALFLSQLHALMSQEVLGLRPDACIGFSAGETAALFAVGAWTEIDDYYGEVAEMGIWTRELATEWRVLETAWRDFPNVKRHWRNFAVFAPLAEVEAALAGEPLVHIVTINAPGNCAIAGQSEACERVIKRLGAGRCQPLHYDLIHHCPEMVAYRAPWTRLNTRPTAPLNIRFYSGADPTVTFFPMPERAAWALIGMSERTIDFPTMIRKAWDDGVRVFIEHGARSACSSYIQQILAGREHLAVSFDSFGAPAVRQVAETVAQLYVAGVPVNHAVLTQRLAQAEPAPSPERRVLKQFAAHQPALQIPALPAASLPVTTPPVTTPQATTPQATTTAPQLQPVRAAGDSANAASLPLTPTTALPAQFPAARNAGDSIKPGVEATAGTPGQPPPIQPARAAGDSAAASLKTASQPLSIAMNEMPPAPPLPSALALYLNQPTTAPTTAPLTFAETPLPESPANATAPPIEIPATAQALTVSAPPAGSPVLAQASTYISSLAQLHQDFVQQQAEAHATFLRMRQNALQALVYVSQNWAGQTGHVAPPPALLPVPAAPPVEVTPSKQNGTPAPAEIQIPAQVEVQKVETAPLPAPVAAPIKAPPLNGQPKPAAPVKAAPSPAAPVKAAPKAPRTPVGPTFNRAQLNIHASGNISEIFGPLFAQQDQYAVQVRMPEPPLLLADRVTGMDAVPGSLKLGTVWTETDIKEDSWFVHQGRILPAMMIESGQADLFLISYLGIDFKNRGERAYRLLGCEATYLAPLPQPGETLCFDIHIDAHAAEGQKHLFFFHYDCHVNGQPVLRVRNGQAGFFTKGELAESKGVLWSAETVTPDAPRWLTPPRVVCQHAQFNKTQLEAFAAGRITECFGPGYEWTQTHTRTPVIAGGRLLLLDEVTHFDPQGGPWGRGYLRAVRKIAPDDWVFAGHFKNDPCMPGTLMTEMAFQGMSVYLTALGYTLDKDGWTFAPVPGELCKLSCRGQVTPTAKELVLEIFVREVTDGPVPTLIADIISTVDGLKALHADRLSLHLTPDFPNLSRRLLPPATSTKPVAMIGPIPCDEKQASDCALGRPSETFGEAFQVFDQGRRTARLPGEPYLFISRITDIDAQYLKMAKGGKITAEWDIPADCVWFDENGARTLPYCVIQEAALQPCGWLSVYMGCPLGADRELAFRNLDGTLELFTECLDTAGTLRTVVENTSIARTPGTIILSFKVEAWLGDRLALRMTTVFGYFETEALAKQLGLPTTDADRAALAAPSDFHVEMADRPARYCQGSLRLAERQLLMYDRVTGYWPQGGETGLGRVRGEKTVRAEEWFFKAHFFQDPVQPGSLGLEVMLQLLQFYMLHEGLGAELPNARFEPLALDIPITWRYRGQVTPGNKLIQTVLDVTETGSDERGVFAKAKASLWCDGLKIYEATNIGMRIVAGAPPLFDRVALEQHASGPIETLFGEQFAPLDKVALRSRVPAPPFLLLDRVTRVNVAAGQLGRGTVWTELDLRADSWFLDDGFMPASLLLEAAGQSGIFLCSWLGADLAQPGARVFRVLGLQDFAFHGPLPKCGDTLSYRVSVEDVSELGGTLLFSLSYECRVGGRICMTTRRATVGYLTPAQLQQAKGVVWTPAQVAPSGSIPPLAPATNATQFSAAQVAAFAQGDLAACFGEAFAVAQRQPVKLPQGMLRQLDEVTDFQLSGGPWQRGYLRAVKHVTPDDWFFKAHFLNDPCIPAVLLGEGCVQSLLFYCVAAGLTRERAGLSFDGWRFVPIEHETFSYQGGGQVTPEAREIAYEVFIETIQLTEQPTVYAHVLVTVDGAQRVLHTRLGLRLQPVA